ncbi:MAG: RuvB-like helicase, partial [Muribaculaceae bacterium]|nr:RuvB-like helicase [Muribaculaceae bacterium]
AGDMTVLGQRENVKLIRKTPEGAKTYTVDLTNYGELAKSPAYYVEAGDVIYVEPNNVRKRETTSNGNNVTSVAFWVSVASLLTSVLVLIKK